IRGHGIEDFGNKVTITDVTVVPVFQASLTTTMMVNCHGCGGTKTVNCRQCNGTQGVRCATCKGSGVLEEREYAGQRWDRCVCDGGRSLLGGGTCSICNGTGQVAQDLTRINRFSCHACNGNGQVACQACNGGQANCSTCSGTGTVQSSQTDKMPAESFEG